MKNLGIILSLEIILGVFVAIGSVSAATDTEQLQPASTITYNEELVVNATGRFDSAYIGKQDEGGVTFFNGTIINTTTGAGSSDNPVTFGDNVRIDGELFRIEVGGDNPIKLADTIKPQTTASYDLGTSTNEFRNAYFSGTVATTALSGTGIVNSTNILDGTIATADLANNAVSSVKIADGNITENDIANNAVTTVKIVNGTIIGDDIASSTNMAINNITAASGTFSGDINQNLTSNGIIKAALLYNANNDTILRSFGLSATAVKDGTGDYLLTFSESITDRYFQITPSATTNVNCVGLVDTDHYPSGNTLNVHCFDADAGGATPSYFMLTIY